MGDYPEPKFDDSIRETEPVMTLVSETLTRSFTNRKEYQASIIIICLFLTKLSLCLETMTPLMSFFNNNPIFSRNSTDLFFMHTYFSKFCGLPVYV